MQTNGAPASGGLPAAGRDAWATPGETGTPKGGDCEDEDTGVLDRLRGIRELCVPCAKALEKKQKIVKVSGGADNKVTCDCCGRRRYGGRYQMGRKRRENGGGPE